MRISPLQKFLLEAFFDVYRRFSFVGDDILSFLPNGRFQVLFGTLPEFRLSIFLQDRLSGLGSWYDYHSMIILPKKYRGLVQSLKSSWVETCKYLEVSEFQVLKHGNS